VRWCNLQAEPISAQVDAYMGWMAEFDPGFVMIAAPRLVAQSQSLKWARHY
jgi:hypothetical protein